MLRPALKRHAAIDFSHSVSPYHHAFCVEDPTLMWTPNEIAQANLLLSLPNLLFSAIAALASVSDKKVREWSISHAWRAVFLDASGKSQLVLVDLHKRRCK